MSHCDYFFFFFKQKTAYEMRISDWSSDVCSSDLPSPFHPRRRADEGRMAARPHEAAREREARKLAVAKSERWVCGRHRRPCRAPAHERPRSEEHTSELQSLMRSSYAVFCLKQKNVNSHHSHV